MAFREGCGRLTCFLKKSSNLISVPGASPMNLAAVDANSSCIEITWSPIPDSLINAPSLLGYEIFWKKYNYSSFNSTMTNQTRAWLTGLQPFTDYNVLVKAVNIVGSGPGSTVLTRKTTEEGKPYFHRGEMILGVMSRSAVILLMIAIIKCSRGPNLYLKVSSAIKHGQ